MDEKAPGADNLTMHSEPHSLAAKGFGALALVFSAYAIVGGLTSLLGWILNVPALTDWNRDGISIQPNAAVAVMAAGTAILLLRFGYRRIAAALGILVAFIGITAALQNAFRVDFGFNSLLMFGREWGRVGVLVRGLMGVPASISWTMIGLALILVSVFPRRDSDAKTRQARSAALALSLVALCISMLSMIGYLYGAEVLYTLPQLTVIAAQTSSFILAVAVALVVSIPEIGLVRLIVEDSPAGVLLRRVMPAVVLVPILLGLVRLAGESAGLYELAFGTAARTLTEMALLLGLLWWTGHAISREARRVSEQQRTVRASENRFIRFMQNLPGLAWIKGADGRYIFANEAARKAFGHGTLTLYGKTDAEIFPPETAAAFVENDQRALSGHSDYQAVEQLADQDGVVHHSIVTKFPIDVGSEGPLIGGIAIEITEQVRAREIQDFLFTISEKIRVSRDAEDLLADIAEALGKHLGVHRCLFNEIDTDADTETVRGDYAREGEHVAGRHKLSDYSRIASDIMSAGQTIVNRDSKNDPRTAEYFEKTYGPNKELSYIAVPMMREGRWVASLWCSDDKLRLWTDQEVAMIENVAERAWAAVARMRSERDLRESEERFRVLADNMDQLGWICDTLGNVTWYNKRWLDYTGLSFDEMKGWDWSKVQHPDHLDRVVARVQRSAETGEPWDDTFPLRGHDGEYRWFLSRAVPIRDQEGNVVRWFGTNTDVTELREAQEGLRRGHTTFLNLIRNAPLGVYIVDSDFRLVQTSAGSEKIFAGIDPLIGRDFDEILRIVWPEPFASEAIGRFRHTLSTGEPYHSPDMTEQRGNIRAVESYDWQIERVTMPDGRFGVVCYFYETTERVRAAEDARFLAEISQDLARLTAVEEMMSSVGAKLGAYFDLSLCAFVEIHEDEETATILVDWHERDIPSSVGVHRISDFMNDELLRLSRAGEIMVVDDVVADSRVNAENFAYFKCASVITIPLVRDGEWRFTLAVQRRFASDWRAEEIELLRELTTRVWTRLERARAEDALLESEERLRIAVKTGKFGTWQLELDDNALITSDTCKANFGLSPGDELTYERLAEMIYDEDRDAWRTAVTRAIDERKDFEAEYRIRLDNGEMHWILAKGRAFYREDGSPFRMIGVTQNITERKQAEEALRDSRERLKFTLEVSKSGDWDLDLQTGKAITSLLHDQCFGAIEPFDEWNYQKFLTYVHPDDRDNEDRKFQAAVASGEDWKIDCRVVWADGSVHWIESSGRNYAYVDGKPTRMLGMVCEVTDRKRAEQALQESRREFEALVWTSAQIVWETEADGTVTRDSPTWRAYTGQTFDEWKDFGWTNAIHPDDRERVQTEWRRHVAAKQPIEIEYRTRHVSGEWRWTVVRATPLIGSDGEIEKWVGMNTDVHDRKQAEESLQQSEEKFRTLADNMSQFAWMADAQGWIFWYNQRWFDYTGTTLEEMQGWGWRKVHHPDHVDRVVEKIQRSWDTGEIWEDTFPLRSETGEYRWFLSRAVPIRDREGNVVRWFGTNTDITERKRSEEELRESEERSSLAQKAGNVGIWDWDATTNFTYWSEKMWAFYGERPRKINPNDGFWMERMHDDDRARVVTNIQQTLASSSTYFRDEYRIVRKDGTSRWIESVATIARDNKGVATRMSGVNLDVTEKKHVAEQIRASEMRLKLVTDTMPALISYVDKNERYRFVNERYSEWFGTAGQPFVGRKLRDVLGTRAYKTIKPHVDAVLAGEEVAVNTWLNYRVAGQRYVHVSYVPDVSPDGEVVGFYALVNDLTELRRSEDLLRSSKERMLTLTGSFTDYAIFSTDVEGRIDSWNPGAENIFGYASDEILGRSGEILFTPEDVAKGVPLTQMRNARGQGRASDERWHVRKDGTRFFASGVLTPLYVGRVLTGYARIASDLTERQLAAEAAQNAREMLEIRVQERTRELNDSNAALRLEIADRQTAERQKVELLHRLVTTQEDERRRVARDLHDQLGQRLTALRLKIASLVEACAAQPDLRVRVERLQQIAQTLDSEVSFLAWELRPSTLDEHGLSESINNFVREWSRHYRTRAEFHAAGTANLRLLPDTETHLYRIAQEAMNNIVKHARAKNVSVLLEKTGDEVTLIVEDDGVGFAGANGKSVEKSGKRLGLTGMRERAALIGGTLEIESVPKKGTTIFARVPIGNGKPLSDR